MDIQPLIEELKEKGMPEIENMAEIVVNAVFNFLEQSIVKSENKYDDFILAVLPMIRKEIQEKLDMIDGKEG